jgi:hypothetical protein
MTVKMMDMFLVLIGILEQDEEQDEEEDELMQSAVSLNIPRPAASQGEVRRSGASLDGSPAKVQPLVTPAMIARVNNNAVRVPAVAHDIRELYPAEPVVNKPKGDTISGRTVGLLIHSTWEDAEFCGLTGFQVLLGPNLVAGVARNDVTADPHGLSVIGYEDDARTPDKLVDGVNNTTCETHMWLFPFTSGARHELRVDLRSEQGVFGVRIWNYNKAVEAAKTRGAKSVSITIDGVIVHSCLLRMVHSQVLDTLYSSSNKKFYRVNRLQDMMELTLPKLFCSVTYKSIWSQVCRIVIGTYHRLCVRIMRHLCCLRAYCGPSIYNRTMLTLTTSV